MQRELLTARIAQERQSLCDDREHEHEEVTIIFRARGLPQEDAERIAEHVIARPKVALDFMAREELGLNPDNLGSPWRAATKLVLQDVALDG